MITLNNITKLYRRGSEQINALCDFNLEIEDKEYLAIVGPSGSGKSTLMNIIGLLDTPDKGNLLLNGVDCTNLTGAKLSSLRRDSIGFVFQQFMLIPSMTALQNVMLPLYFTKNKDSKEIAKILLKKVGLENRITHLPSELSGGEMQRVAIARALVQNPKVLLADEPTGNLDSKTAQGIYELFEEINSLGTTVIIVTHNTELPKAIKRTVHLKDGRLIEDEKL